MDYVREVSTKKIYRWDPEIAERAMVHPPIVRMKAANRRSAHPIRIAAYDYGIKENILRLLRQKGFGVTVVPATTSATKRWR